MSSRGQPQYNYVPVRLTHIEQAAGRSSSSNLSSSGSGSGAALSSSGNLHKWQAFGLNSGADSLQSTGRCMQQPHMGNTNNSVNINTPSFTNGGSVVEREKRVNSLEKLGMSTIHRQLMELSARVGGKAREIRSFISPQGETSGKNNTSKGNNKNTASSPAADAAGGKRHRGGDGSEHDGKRACKKSATVKNNEQFSTEIENDSSAAADLQEEKGNNNNNKNKNKQATRKSRAPKVPAKRAAKEPECRALFTMPTDTLRNHRSCEPVEFKEIDDGVSLFADLQETLKDPNRIQAPTLFVAFILQGRETNFSISSSTHGKNHFIRMINPQVSHLKVQSFVLRWKDDVFVLPGTTGLSFLVRIIEELPGVEIVTFNAPSLLLLLLSYKQSNLFTSCISDVRLMAWMLKPSVEGDAFTDYDVLLESYQQRIGLAAGFGDMENRWTVKETVCHRVHYMLPLYRSLYSQLGTQGLLPAFLKQEKRISLLCALMKFNGFPVNLSEVDGFKARCSMRMEELTLAARKLVPSMPDLNLQNLDECRVALYEVLLLGKHLTHTREDGTTDTCSLVVTKSGKLSTSEDTLKLLAPHHEFPRVLIAYRKTAKLLQTYTVGMMETAFPLVDDNSEFTDTCILEKSRKVDDNNNDSNTTIKWVKLYPNFVQEGTDTGRLSCVEPNLQSLPRAKAIISDERIEPYEAEMATFRRCFAVSPGWTLLSVDYEQIELRVLAHLSADAALVDALTNAEDIHRSIAERIYRKSPVSSEERTLAKRVVFGMLYGAGPRTLAAQMGVSVEEALHMMSLFKASYPHIDQYHRRVIEQCRADGYIRTMSGRIRLLPDINDRAMAKRSYAERQAFNSVIQGSAADVMKLGMLALERDVLRPYSREVRLLAQVHDEVVLSLPTAKLQEVVPRVARSMTHAVSMLVPLRVTAKIGQSLGELEEWTVDHELGIR